MTKKSTKQFAESQADTNVLITSPLLNDFLEFSYMLTHLQEQALGGKENWKNEIEKIAALRQASLKLLQWETNPNLDESRIRVAVIGDFSSGKSSFINSLLGESLCPVDVSPTTSSITTFKYGDKKQIYLLSPDEKVCGSGVKKREISRDEYERYVSHQGSEGLRYEFEVYYPFSGFRDIELYDTPGFGNPRNEDDERITLDKCEVADAVFLVFDINKGNLSETLKKKILQIRLRNNKLRICTILNRSDKMTPGVVADICENWKEEDIFSDVIAYSSTLELEQFKEKQTETDMFFTILYNSMSPYFVRQDQGKIFYKAACLEPSSSRSAVLKQFDAIQYEKKLIFNDNMSKYLRDYLVRASLSVGSIVIKLERELYNELDSKKAPLESILWDAIQADETIRNLRGMVKSAVNAAFIRREMSRQEKSYWNTPWWMAKFVNSKFTTSIRKSHEKKLIAARVDLFLNRIPAEYFQYVKEACTDLKNQVINLDILLIGIANDIKDHLPGVKDDFDNEQMVLEQLRYYQDFAVESVERIYNERVNVLVIEIIKHLASKDSYGLGATNAKQQYVVEFHGKLRLFAEALKSRSHEKEGFDYV